MAKLPSIQALRVIESVERNGSIWRAADELCVTRSAVSHQLRLLESALGFKALVRVGNRTDMTPRARAYAQEIRQALNMIANSSSILEQDGLSGSLTISCTPGFLSGWLCININEFAEANPDIVITIVNPRTMTGATNPNVDTFITFGPETKPNIAKTPLQSVEFSPLCSPAYMTRFDGFKDPRSLEVATLLHIGDFTDWHDWMQQSGLPTDWAAHGICVPEMHVAHSALLAGQGIAIGDTVLWSKEIRSGQLMRPFSGSLHSETRYYLCTPVEKLENPVVAEFSNWLTSRMELKNFEAPEVG